MISQIVHGPGGIINVASTKKTLSKHKASDIVPNTAEGARYCNLEIMGFSHITNIKKKKKSPNHRLIGHRKFLLRKYISIFKFNDKNCLTSLVFLGKVVLVVGLHVEKL